jgi:ABC-type amino acid transport substrate-binding protein
MLIFVMCATLLPIGHVSTKAEERTIRVGYDANSNFIKESNGNYYGYGVDYLEKIAEYTGWKYEYIQDESWHNCLEMLRHGEIDVICTAHYTESRAQEFLYSEMPLGYEASLLYAKTDSTIAYQDFEAMNGARIGLLMDSYSAQDFEQYAIRQNIQYQGVYYEEEDQMLQDLEHNQIDMIVIAGRYASPELKLIDTSGANAFYCITNKDNSALIRDIDETLRQIIFDEPAFEGELIDAYFGHNALSNMPLYTKEELSYIDSLGTVKIKVLQNQKPSCYIEDGQTKGIWVETIKLLAKKTGIDKQSTPLIEQ